MVSIRARQSDGSFRSVKAEVQTHTLDNYNRLGMRHSTENLTSIINQVLADLRGPEFSTGLMAMGIRLGTSTYRRSQRRG
ncbi:hypothetical protein C491_15177 [Natronococcus amylolyticus DSM 10524]|uniref:Uncharacterized protein n=1 Tax=Natronococcus amylolyticus DSM 10524 TaxID=1227497 RepID=L9X4A5_9EURY|nr:hypothetical protein C491_15177 [Natronococcus amylolyticus DSM 10524]